MGCIRDVSVQGTFFMELLMKNVSRVSVDL